MPQITPLKKLKQGKSQTVVTFTPDETAKAEQKAVERLGERIRVEGFRPGRAPADMIKQKINPDDLRDETVRILLPPVFEELLKGGDLRPIIPPKVELTSKEPLTLTLVFVEKPDVKVKGADKIKIEKKSAAVEAKDIDRMAEYLRGQYRTTKSVGRAVKDGDQVTLDFVGKADGKEVDGTKAEGYRLIVGGKSLIPGFEEALVGMNKGETKSFTLTFPADYHVDVLKSKPVEFTTTMKEVEEVQIPELTDEFVKEHHMGTSAAELRGRIETSLKEQRDQEEKGRRERELFDAIREKTVIDLPEEIVAHEERAMLEDIQRTLEQEKLTFEEWLKRTDRTVEKFQQEMAEEAKKRLTLRFAIQWLMEDKKVEVTPEELDAAHEMMIAGVPEQEREKASAYYKEGGEGYEELKWRKKVEKLVEGMLAN